MPVDPTPATIMQVFQLQQEGLKLRFPRSLKGMVEQPGGNKVSS